MADFHILYLENNRFFANQVKMRLEWRGYQVDISDNEQDCLAKLRQRPYDLFLLDFYTPQPDGFRLLEQLQNRKIMPATIIISSRPDFGLATKAMNMGCIDIVLKDTVLQQFLERLNLSIFQFYENQRLKLAKQDALIDAIPIEKEPTTLPWEYYPDKDKVIWQGDADAELVALKYDDFLANISEEDLVTVKTRNNICLFSQQTVEYTFHYHANGKDLRHYRANIEAETNRDGTVKRLHGRLRKLSPTARVPADKGSKLKQAFLDNTPDAVFATDDNRRIISVNHGFSKLTGYNEQEVLQQPSDILNPEQFDKNFFQPIAAALKSRQFWQGETTIRHRNGHTIPVWQCVSILKDSRGNISQSISVLRDISQQKAFEASIQFQANYDPLTRLPNRTLFMDRLNSAIKQGKRNQKKLALMLVDLDKFKWINDNLGHHAGDLLLQETGKRLQASVRNSDTVARLGGDEFAIVVPDLDKASDAEVIARKIFDNFKRHLYIDRQQVFISGSIGITLYPDDGNTSDDLLKNADSAMYMAKHNGRNCYYYYTPALQQETEKRLQLIEDMRQAMENQEFSLHYQPIIDMATKKVACAETLLRWQRPQSGFVPLQQFIPVAEESGLIHDIGNWVIEETAGNIQRWSRLGLEPVRVSLNQSVAQYNQTDCYVEWLDILSNKKVEPQAITFEINEKLFLDERDNYAVSVEKLKQAGIQISLDGFGTGYSSLSYLKKCPVDVIKIDRSYIQGMLDDPANAILVETIVSLANKLGIKVIATGVENQRQLALLNHQCRYAQGYYFSRPLSLSEFEDFVRMKNR
ncbi:EAL domain-containing response regulator [Methylomarinum vadi]|uniref:EAL domain-containing response regulator n=1 Tax=Methylomarinum vadi TaxID=438855 RepID=UPI00068D8561|nr:EAL domain-containing protein [Methylomarinum vadi]